MKNPAAKTSAIADMGFAEKSRWDWVLCKVWRTFWYLVFPVALTALFSGSLLPTAVGIDEGRVREATRLLLANPVLECVLLFLIFSGLTHYWRHYLPGFRVTLPLHIASPKLLKGQHLRRLEAILSASSLTAVKSTGVLQVQELEAALVDGNVEYIERLATIVRTQERQSGQRIPFGIRSRSLGLIAVFMVTAGLLRLFLFQSYAIVGTSMLPTFDSGDEVGVRPSAYGFAAAGFRSSSSNIPQRGDVVILDNPTSQGETHVVKRVVALPGDQVTFRGGVPIINGWRVPTCDAGLYANVTADFVPIQGHLVVEFLGARPYLTLYESTKSATALESTYTVKPGEVFVLGDNRNASLDSRAWNGASLSRIRGRVDWFLVGTHRIGTADFSRLFRHVELEPALAGIDTSAISRNIQQCISHKPSQTWPPARAAQSLVAQVSPPS